MNKLNNRKHIYTFGDAEYDLDSRTHIIGIINVTPDSFSDGGKYEGAEEAVDAALAMVADGADFIDVGGESTRPGSEPVPLEVELKRVIPVIENLAKATSVPLSVDTYKSAVAAEALRAGARIVNDISGLHFDAQMAEVIAQYDATVVIMHIRGTPRTMQTDVVYRNLIGEIRIYLEEGIRTASEAGIRQIILDPGIGFGKNTDHNFEIFKRLGEFRDLGYPILVGPSRKSFIGKILNLPVEDRLEGTAAAVAVSIMNGANILRVHDVKEMKRVAIIADAIRRANDENKAPRTVDQYS
jgi:dihydropteroate synthase